jgi:hypothetical protein
MSIENGESFLLFWSILANETRSRETQETSIERVKKTATSGAQRQLHKWID